LGQFLFFFQAGNLDFLGLNLAWSLDVLSVLALTSALALVLALGELLFTSRFVGRLGATLFLLYGSLGYLPILTFGFHHEEPWGFAKQIAFISERHLPFLIGLFLVILIFVIDQYRLTGLPADARSETNGALRQLKETGDCPPAQMDSAPKGITSLLIPAKSYVFSGLLLAAIPVWAPSAFISAAMSMCCLLVAYGFWWLLRLKTARTPGRVLAVTLMACIIAIGVSNLIDVYGSSLMTIDYKQEPLVKGLGFRKLTTYKLPASSSPDSAHENSSTPAVTAFEGGQGNGRGQFDSPRGIATDSTGNIFIADTGNGRIEKFSPSATFLTTIAIRENAEGKLGAPNGIAIDKLNNVYVADASKHVVERLAPNGTVLDDWEGPPPGFYGPRRIAIGPDDSLYIVDQGRTRIVKLNLKGQVLTTWGSGGSGDGQFNDHTSVAVDPATNKVYVADPRNSRIQIFDSNGNFLTKWSIPEWKQPHGFEDLAIDSQRSRLYASSMHMNRILSFNLEGIRLGTLTPQPPDKLDQPSAIALAKDKLLVLDTGSARVSVIPLPAR
jgi:DNA-binding beta-propeller fold protein YncE